MGEGYLNPNRLFSNKWEMYKLLRNEKIGPCLLPYTELFSEKSFAELLEKYNKIYIIPVDTWGGKFISLIQKSKNQIVWKSQNNDPVFFDKPEDCFPLLKNHYSRNSCIIQQSAPLIKYRHHPFDIRIYMQRDLDDSWVYAGHLTRVSESHSIVSNIAISKGKVVDFRKIILDIFSNNQTFFDTLLLYLKEIGYSIIKILDKNHYSEEVGVDLGIDEDGHLWLIEVTTNDSIGKPSFELFSMLPDKRVYEQMCKRYEERYLMWALSIFDRLLDEK